MAMHTEVREEVKYASAQRRGVLWCHTGQEGAQHLERRVLFLFHNRLLSSSIKIIKYSSYCIIRKGITLLPNLSLAMWKQVAESLWEMSTIGVAPGTEHFTAAWEMWVRTQWNTIWTLSRRSSLETQDTTLSDADETELFLKCYFITTCITLLPGEQKLNSTAALATWSANQLQQYFDGIVVSVTC